MCVCDIVPTLTKTANGNRFFYLTWAGIQAYLFPTNIHADFSPCEHRSVKRFAYACAQQMKSAWNTSMHQITCSHLAHIARRKVGFQGFACAFCILNCVLEKISPQNFKMLLFKRLSKLRISVRLEKCV